LDITASITAFLCALYAHVLGRTVVQPDDDFFADLNGDSLAAAQVIVVLEDLFQINVVEAFFDDSRAASIAPLLERHLQSRAATSRSWPDGSSLLDSALNDELALLRQLLSPPQGSVVE
jgi:acyl carrier protein